MVFSAFLMRELMRSIIFDRPEFCIISRPLMLTATDTCFQSNFATSNTTDGRMSSSS